jgi:hypothetical protein
MRDGQYTNDEYLPTPMTPAELRTRARVLYRFSTSVVWYCAVVMGVIGWTFLNGLAEILRTFWLLVGALGGLYLGVQLGQRVQQILLTLVDGALATANLRDSLPPEKW